MEKVNRIFRYRSTDYIMMFIFFITLISAIWNIVLESKINSVEEDKVIYSLNNEYIIKVSGTEKDIIDKILASNFEMIEQSNVTVLFNDTYKSCLISVFVDGDISKWYPLTKGRYPTENEINNGEKVVLIGRKMTDGIKQIEENEYICINNENYKVVGHIGTNTSYLFDYSVVLFNECIGEKTKSILLNSGSNMDNEYHIGDDEIALKDAYSLLLSEINKQCENAHLEIKKYERDNFENENRLEYFPMLMVISLCIVEALIFSEIWFEKRKKEILIRKIYGYDQFKIFKYYVMEIGKIIILSFFAFLISVLAYITFGDNITYYSKYFVYLYLVYALILWALLTIKLVALEKKNGDELFILRKMM